MNDLYFLVNWENNQQRAWSGTCYGLYKALTNYYNVHDIDIYKHRRRLVHSLFQKIGLASNDFGISGIEQSRKYVGQKLSNLNNYALLQFEEIVTQGFCNTYIYQDLSVSYIKYLSENDPEILKYSGFDAKNINKAIIKRYNSQMDYYKSCSGILTMGKWLQRDLVERCGIPKEKVFHVGGGINLDPNKIKPTLKTKNKILFVGRDFKRKGGFLVYEAFKLLKSTNKDVQLYIAGPISNPIKDPIDGYFYLGECTYEQLSQMFNECDIFCMPSYFEAYGLVFIEALSYGLPCIGRNVYEMPYFIEDNETGYLLDNDSPYKLAELMNNLLLNDTIKHNVLKKKEWYLKQYSWDSVAQRIYEIINNYKE